MEQASIQMAQQGRFTLAMSARHGLRQPPARTPSPPAPTMGRLLEYFLVCGLGPDLQTTESPPDHGYFGTSVYYAPALLDQFPPSDIADCPDPPPQLPLCVLPGGVQLYSQGPSSQDPSSLPRSYPIVLTEGDGSKIYLSCIAFRDPVDDDVAQAYNIPANTYVGKCICFLSHSSCFELFRDALEEIYRCCFSASGSSKPIWDIIAHVVMSVPLPSPGMGQILFSVDCYQLTVEAPPKDGFPHADMSFEPLVQSLDIENLIQLFTAVLLERRVLLRANKYSVLTVVAECIRHLIYPVQWQVYLLEEAGHFPPGLQVTEVQWLAEVFGQDTLYSKMSSCRYADLACERRIELYH